MPLGLEDQFAQDQAKQTQWRAFLAKNRLEAPALEIVVREVRSFVDGPVRKARVDLDHLQQ